MTKPFTVGMRNALLPYLEDEHISFNLTIANGVITYSAIDRWTGEGAFRGDTATTRYFPNIFPFLTGRRFVETDETPFLSGEQLDLLSDLLTRYAGFDNPGDILGPSIYVWISPNETRFHLYDPNRLLDVAHNTYARDYDDFVAKVKDLVDSLAPAVAV
jgi:hypothetical protein